MRALMPARTCIHIQEMNMKPQRDFFGKEEERKHSSTTLLPTNVTELMWIDLTTFEGSSLSFNFILLTLLYFTLLYFTLLYFTLLCFTSLYFTLLHFTLLYFTLLYFTLLYSTLFVLFLSTHQICSLV